MSLCLPCVTYSRISDLKSLIPGSEARPPSPLGGVPCAYYAPEFIPAPTNHEILGRLRRPISNQVSETSDPVPILGQTHPIVYSADVSFTRTRDERKKKQIYGTLDANHARIGQNETKLNWSKLCERMNGRMVQLCPKISIPRIHFRWKI